MTIYNINLGIGWASSGVEYAQAYRGQIFRQLGQPAKFIFNDMILADNIQHLTENIGFKDQEIIWIYNYFTDIKIAPTTYTIAQVLASVEGEPTSQERNGRIARAFYDGDFYMTLYLKNEEEDFVERVEYVSRGCLIRKDYFSYTRYCSEYFVLRDGGLFMSQRRFYNEDGSTAYDMVMDGNNQEALYRFPDHICYSKSELVGYLLDKLELTEQDIVILDRETGIGQIVFEKARPAKLGVVVHAEHYSENATNEDYILWNNYYDYQFTNADKVDFFIVATDRQKEILQEQFRHYNRTEPRIFTIPVGSLPELKKPSASRKPFGMVTASRLATEKHIDWLIHAVVEARKTLPALTLDIYGKGGEEQKLRQLIKDKQAQDFIVLKGHADMTDVYSQYQVYLAASTSEGFGLTLMEALGSGLPLIGFDVPYGNQTFIRDGVNGYLLPLKEEKIEEDIAQAFAEKICQIYQEDLLSSMQEAAYARAEDFLTSRVEAAWSDLIKEVLA